MPRRRRIVTVAALLTCVSTIVAGCGGSANGRSSTDPTPASTTTSSSTSPTSESDTWTPPTEEPTKDAYTIRCHLVPQSLVDQWTKGGEPASVEVTENGCRVVSSDPEGALMIQWQYLDVRNSSDDRGLVREISKTSKAVDLAPKVTAVRSETDVEPTRKTRLYVTFGNGRTLFVEATATLDRPRSMKDLRGITTKIVMTYAGQPELDDLPMPTDPTPSSTS